MTLGVIWVFEDKIVGSRKRSLFVPYSKGVGALRLGLSRRTNLDNQLSHKYRI